MGVHIGATFRIPLNRPCAAAMRPYVKLLWCSTAGVQTVETTTSGAGVLRTDSDVWRTLTVTALTASAAACLITVENL